MRVLVTGGAGFIGSAFVRAWIADGAGEVLNVDKLTYAGDPSNLEEAATAPGHRLLETDIRDERIMQAAFETFRPQAVVNLAAETHVDRSIDHPTAFVDSNVVGTAVLLECALRHWQGLDAAGRTAFRFLQVSTDEVFGDLGQDGVFTEASPIAPSSPYAASKAAADLLALAFHRTYGLGVIVANATNTFGPHQFPEKLIPLMIVKARRGEALPLYGGGGQVRDWLHVDDHVAALRRLLASGRPGERYLVGARRPMSNLDMVRRVAALLDELLPHSPHRPHRRLIQTAADRPGHDRRYAADPSKLERELGWRPAVDFEAGMRATVSWFLENGEWCERAARRYQQQRLGVPSPPL